MMIRVTSIALTFALYGYADAVPPACHPTFSSSATYGPGDTVSATSTVETTTACDCGTPGCPTPTGQLTGCEVTTSTTEKHNYQCVSNANSAFCSSIGYEPGAGLQVHWSIAWTKESEECSGTVTVTPPPTPAVWSQTDSGCPGAYVSGEDYEPAEVVSVVEATHTEVYQCAAAPNNLFCGQAGYKPGTLHGKTVWTALGSCSGTIAPTTSPNYVTLQDMGGCPGAWEAGAEYEEYDRASKNGLVFQCAPYPHSGHCGSVGYEPMSDDGTVHWKEAWTVVGYCSGTIAPTVAPSFDDANDIGGCPDEWVKGDNTSYEEGDMASITVSTNPLRQVAYTCKSWPLSGHCGQHAPNSGLPDDHQGWTLSGSCSGTIAPTTSPSFDSNNVITGGCPEDYDENNLSGIEDGDLVSLVVSDNPYRRIVYKCKSGAVSAYCNQAAYIPGGQFSSMAWDLMGPCEGTMFPTMTPTNYNNADISAPAECEVEAAGSGTVKQCYYKKAITTEQSCTCSDPSCPNPNDLSSGCKTDVTEITCPSVDVYSSSASYEAGDVVRMGTKKFQCKSWPYVLWCSNSAYEPLLEAGIWSDAWSEIGDCPAP